MKKIYHLLVLFLIPTLMSAQELLPEQEALHIFIAPIIEIGEIAGETGLSAGMKGGVRINQTWLGLYHTQQDRFCIQNASQEDCNGRTQFVGIWTGREKVVTENLAIYGGIRAGWGLLELQTSQKKLNDTRYQDEVLVLAPEAGLNLQLNRHIQLAWTSGFRWINGVEGLPGLKNKDFTSLVNTLSIRFGW